MIDVEMGDDQPGAFGRLDFIAFALLMSIIIAGLIAGVVVIAGAAFRSKAEPEKTVEIHCGDYVRVEKGFYTGFEGWAKTEETLGMIKLKLNDKSLPVDFLKEKNLSSSWTENRLELRVQESWLKVVPEPPKGSNPVELLWMFEFVRNQEKESWVKVDDFRVDGLRYSVEIRRVPEKAEVDADFAP